MLEKKHKRKHKILNYSLTRELMISLARALIFFAAKNRKSPAGRQRLIGWMQIRPCLVFKAWSSSVVFSLKTMPLIFYFMLGSCSTISRCESGTSLWPFFYLKCCRVLSALSSIGTFIFWIGFACFFLKKISFLKIKNSFKSASCRKINQSIYMLIKLWSSCLIACLTPWVRILFTEWRL